MNSSQWLEQLCPKSARLDYIGSTIGKHQGKMERLVRLVIFIAVLVCLLQTNGAATAIAQTKPNLILINLDDADATLTDSFNLRRFPHLKRMAEEGLRFGNCHVTTPICGPSRSCLFRAQYAHNTGLFVNDSNIPFGNGLPGGFRAYRERGYFTNDISTWIKDAGYRTMMIGKFLHADVENIVPSGWDEFYHSFGARYYNTIRLTTRNSKQGMLESLPPGAYRTDAEREDMLQLIDSHMTSHAEKPFFLYLAPLTPHRQGNRNGVMIDSRYENWWTKAIVPRTIDFDEANIDDKTGVLSQLNRLTPQGTDFIDGHFRDRLRAMKSFDELLGSLFDKLESLGIDNKTYVFLTSDNGFSQGHFRFFGKMLPMERTTNVPLLVKGPGIPQNESANHLLAHIDITPTLVDLAAGTIPAKIDGQSFASLLFAPTAHSERNWREPILIENFMSGNTLSTKGSREYSYSALRLYEEIYVEYADGNKEYYHLPTDPFQIQNAYDSLNFAEQEFFATSLRNIKASSSIHPPVIGQSFPFEKDVKIPRLSFLKGTCTDDGGVTRVKVAIKDLDRNLFWNGDAWQTNFVQVPAQVLNRNGLVSNWQYRLGFPADQVPKGRIRNWVWATDRQGKFSSAPGLQPFFMDHEAPFVDLDFPETNNHKFASSVFFRGSVTDDLQIREVQLIIRDVDENKFWNGSEFQQQWTYVTANVIGQNWIYSSPLKVGTYNMVIRAMDTSRNLSENIPRLRFTVR